MDEILQIKHALVLKEAKNVFNKVIEKDPIVEGLYMIDAIQRLSVDHLFEEEIQKTLLKQTSIISDFKNHIHLSQIALQFRLLRQAGLCAHADPKFSEQRIELTKSVSLVYIIDDIFDVYGSLDDLTCFTDAVNRVLRNPTNPLKKSWAALLYSFLVEARWLNSGDLPKAKEYLENGIVTSGVHVVFLHAFFLLLDQNITQQNVAVIDQISSLSSLVGKILRLCDDLEGAKSDDQNGKDGSYLECYMKENEGVSVEDAQTHVSHLISNAWKRLNQETLITSSPFAPSFTEFCLNASRMVLLMYSYRRNQSLLNLQEYVKSLLRVD
ncbi:hypothetical protein K1719_022693 [Acacia pycnantha]|nr:hypothetical protein K1719_022693 [Acacia pycnantha]